jgi:MTH538 TIR-like domain (DUF1863)
MGGGGGGGPSKRDLDRLEEIARTSLREAAGAERKNVFISFAYEDYNDVNLLRGQAKNENAALEFNDWSLREPFDSSRADYIKSGIRERIEKSSVTLVYLSRQTAKSKWVDWEIRESIKLGKGILAVYKGDSPPKVLPSAMAEFGRYVTLTPWTHQGISAAIEKASKKRS